MIRLSKHWAITLSHLKSRAERLTLLQEFSWALHTRLPLTNRAAVRVNDTLQFPSLISKHRLISLVSYSVCGCVCRYVCGCVAGCVLLTR